MEMAVYLDAPMNATPERDRLPWYHAPEYYTGKTQQWYKITPSKDQDYKMWPIFKAVIAQGFVARYMEMTGVVWVMQRSERDMSILLLLVGSNTISIHTKLI